MGATLVSALHDKRDRVIAYVDYEVVNQEGKWDNYGEYCYIRFVWVHHSIKNKYTLKSFVMEEHKKFPTVRFLYYQHQKRGDDRMRIYPITRFYKK